MTKRRNPWPKRLRAIRDRLNLTREQLAAKIGVAPRTVMYYELGSQQPSPPVQLLIGLVDQEKI